MDQLLEIGNIIYQTHNNSVHETFKITRTTATQALTSSSVKFKRQVSSSGYVTLIGGGTWSIYSYYLETDVLKAKLHRQQSIEKLTNTKFHLLPDDTIDKLISILV